MGLLRSFIARLLTLALTLSVLGMHVPLDALRSRAAALPTDTCCTSLQTALKAHDAVPGDPSPPSPRDGCDEGCHCGCCGRLPIAAEVNAEAPSREAGLRRVYLEPIGARCHRPREVFHPPRA